MKSIQIILKGDDIYINEYLSLNSKSIVKTLKNKEVYDYLNYNTRYTIRNIYENESSIQVEYDDFVVSFDEKIFSNFYSEPLMNQINRHNNKKNASKNKEKKVTRKNQHQGRKVIAIGLALSILIGLAAHLKKKNTQATDITTTISYEEDTEENKLLVNNPPQIQEEDYLHICYPEFTPDNTKLDYVKKNYSKLIEEYSDMYGIDANIMIAIAAQERGIHSSTRDPGGATGLMQIQNSVWVGKNLKVFNYKIGDYEEIVVTEEMLSDLENNIKIGCMIFADTLYMVKGNVLLAIQCYNMGYGNMMIVIDKYSINSGKDVLDIMANPRDIGWLKYREIIKFGDQHYLERILAYMGTIVNIDSLGERLIIYVSESKAKVR